VALDLVGLFVRLGRGGRQTGQRMSSSAIMNVVRRTAIHELIESGVSLAEVHRRFGFVSHLTLARRQRLASCKASLS
jgi:transposase-like protein